MVIYSYRHQTTHIMTTHHPTTLLTILTNQLLLLSTTPYLSACDIYALTLTSRALRNSITSSPSVHRHLDLSTAARSKVLPRLLTDTPHHRILHATRTLILDNLPVTIAHLNALISPPNYKSNIQILSIRGCREIVERELMTFLTGLVSSADELSLKGVYWFSDHEAAEKPTGRFIRNARMRLGSEWVPVLQACAGRITFDTVVCEGHMHESVTPTIANIRLGGSRGCSGCGQSQRSNKALVAPAPFFGGIAAACRGGAEGGMLRCEGCVKERWCECCGEWWCTDCAVAAAKVKRTCFECGSQCSDCTAKHSRTCLSCSGGYCITHNEGADESYCEWCIAASVPRRGSAPMTSNSFLTSPARSYFLSLGLSQPSAASKPRTVSSGTPFKAATKIPIGGRQFQKEIGGRQFPKEIGGRQFQKEIVTSRRVSLL